MWSQLWRVTLIDSWNFNSSYSKRTITWGRANVKYLKWNTTPSKKIQVEFGIEKTEYYDYLLPINNENVIYDVLNDENKEVAERTFISDYNSQPFTSYAKRYNSKILETSGNNEQFLFFTDPHLAIQSGGAEGMKEITIPVVNFMQAVYNASPFSFCMCGGDWLGNSDTPDVASSKLTYIDGFMRKKFSNYLPINGNHDTNYQGKETAESEVGTGRIENGVLKEFTLKFRDENRMYYAYNAPTSRVYVFDTGTENETISAYQNEQLSWFATRLLSDNTEHIIIALHIIYPSIVGGTVQPITEKILQIAQAYNNRSTITINGVSYDYASVTGKVSFCISGHTHSDYTATINDIPCIITTQTIVSGVCTFDMCIADWTNKKLHLLRVGNGSDRTVNIL